MIQAFKGLVDSFLNDPLAMVSHDKALGKHSGWCGPSNIDNADLLLGVTGSGACITCSG